MQQLTDEQQTDNLSEYRVGRFAYYQQAIDTEYANFKAACAIVKSHSLRLCELLHAANQERIWAVDGYDNMTQWVNARWPEISKVRLSQMLAGGAILEEYERWADDELTKNGNLLTLPRPENEGQLRTLHGIEPAERRESYQSAVVSAGGTVPSAREISEAYLARTGQSATDERMDRLDLDSGPQNGKWIDATGGAHEGIANMPNPAVERKERFTEDIRCDGHRLHYQLVVKRGNGQSPLKWYGFISRKQWESAGFSYHGKAQHAMDEEDFTESAPAAPAETNGNGATRMDAGVREKLIAEKKRLEAIGAPVLFAGKLADEDAADFSEDDPPTAGSFIAGSDLSYADAPTENIAIDAMNKMFEDDYPQ